MADKHINGSDSQKPTWTDGLPHEFKGWGPQTPDPDADSDDLDLLAPQDELTWGGDSDERNHFVWRFDGRRRHHHH